MRDVQGVHGAVFVALIACGYPRPPQVSSDARSDSICAANQALRCEGNVLVRCNGEGNAEVSQSCALGCNATAPRCRDVDPSNGLAQYLDMAATEPAFDFGMKATINTDDGTVMVDDNPVIVKSAMVTQSAAPAIRVLVVHSLVTTDVTIAGKRALAIVSDRDLQIGGVFAASANLNVPGAGGFNDGTCKGGDIEIVAGGASSGAGGGGFGLPGGRGGQATNSNGTASGGAGGTSTGNSALVPLRGGCDSGNFLTAAMSGAGGGAIQLVSRSKISISGVIAANGSSLVGGGSGGGILLEAPVVDVSGNVVANGGGGAGGCSPPNAGENGRLDPSPASGGPNCPDGFGTSGGNGGARNTGAMNGASYNSIPTGANNGHAGHGGGSVGRIRVNTAPAGLHVTGVFSPNPSTGTLATR